MTQEEQGGVFMNAFLTYPRAVYIFHKSPGDQKEKRELIMTVNDKRCTMTILVFPRTTYTSFYIIIT